MCRVSPRYLCSSLGSILTEYTIFIVTLPMSYVFLSPARALCISAGTFVLCTAIALCSWCARQREEAQTSRQQDIVPDSSSDQKQPNGLHPSLIASLPTYVYKKTAAGVDGLDCTVCLAGICQEEIVKPLPFCTHLFHKDCIDRWLAFQSTCPVCRVAVNLDLETEISLNVKC